MRASVAVNAKRPIRIGHDVLVTGNQRAIRRICSIVDDDPKVQDHVFTQDAIPAEKSLQRNARNKHYCTLGYPRPRNQVAIKNGDGNTDRTGTSIWSSARPDGLVQRSYAMSEVIEQVVDSIAMVTVGQVSMRNALLCRVRESTQDSVCQAAYRQSGASQVGIFEAPKQVAPLV